MESKREQAPTVGTAVSRGVHTHKGYRMQGWMELTEFDKVRPVRQLVKDKRMISLPVRTLNSDLTCRVCLGIIRQVHKSS